MNHVLAVLALAAACAVWLLVQRLTGRDEDGCCGMRPPEERKDCSDCPERRGAAPPGGVGAAFLVICDTIARSLLGGRELPVGAITAIAGGPLFLWLLRRHHLRGVRI